ncbi:MAG: hypothetical protein K5764_10650 [Prevotella sp.]|nr:hypothetical protein [Prevotella sp.]
MTNIVQRNFFRLIRIGAFDQQEAIEPMSAYKWSMLFQLSVMHDVAEDVYAGLKKARTQFFCHLTEQQWMQWHDTLAERAKVPRNDEAEEDEFLRADHLTNPLLNHKLQAILDDEQTDTTTRQLLLLTIRVARHILNEGVPIRQLLELGRYLQGEGRRAEFTTLQQWLRSLSFDNIAQLESTLLTTLFHISAEDLPYPPVKNEKKVERVAQELIEFTNTRAQDFIFSQEQGNIFVHTSNGTAMMGHVKRSARYFRYFPSETVTNFFASFAHSLSHIEE